MQNAGTLSQIVETWRTLELFCPTRVPKETRGRCDRPTIAWNPGQQLPWHAGHECQRWLKPNHCWQHTVFLGLFELEDMYEALHQVFPPVSTAYDEPSGGASAVLKFGVNHLGGPDTQDLVLSMAAWGLGVLLRTRRSFDLSRAAFEMMSAALKRNLEQYFLDALSKYDPAALDEATLLGASAGMQTLLGLDKCDGLRLRPALISSRQVMVQGDVAETQRDGSPDFHNSLFIDDLDAVYQSIRNRSVQGPLAGYLGQPTPDQEKTDLRRCSYAQRLDLLSVERMPLGKWPGSPSHPLSTSQQLALNLAFEMQKTNRALFSINGPPGTGKTTLLRELVAAVVTQRAQAIAALSRPEDGFSGKVCDWTCDGHPRRVYELAEPILGHEILIASSNTTALEKLSLEMPDARSLGGGFEDAQYFAEFATTLLQSSSELNAQGWGLISAQLGDRNNRIHFATQFWSRRNEEDPSQPANLQEWLQRVVYKGRPIARSWSQAVQRFKEREQEVQRLLQEARRAMAKISELRRVEGLERECGRLREEIAVKRGDYVELSRAQERFEQRLQACQERFESEIAQVHEHMSQKPGFFESAWTLGKKRQVWNERTLQVREQLDNSARDLGCAKQDHERCQARVRSARIKLASLETQEAKLNQEIIALECLAEKMVRRWGPVLPDSSWFNDDTRREALAPWLSPEICRARSELFLAALDLHVDFLEHNAAKMLQNLRAAMDIVQGTRPLGLEEKTLLTAWQSLFLVVPTATTTFASVGKMLEGVGANRLGWLLVDEAGQATPQSVVGAMWRSKKAVVVGDSMQLTPVLTLPAKVEGEICDALSCPTWARARTSSVQFIADARNPWGTFFGAADKKLRWVGAPLLVHRRCLEPMFGICNAMAYDVSMFHGCAGTVKRYPKLPASAWIDIKAQPSGDSHALRADTQFCAQLMKCLIERHHVEAKDVILMSPFRDMVAALRATLPRLSQRCKSIHAAQGQHAPIVVLALGGHPNRPRARAWVASTPNLLSVAVSGARDQIYVVGDWEAWGGLRYVEKIARTLPTISASRFLAKVARFPEERAKGRRIF